MTYSTSLQSWGSTGTAPPSNYSYAEGEQPVDEWDNWFNYHVIDEIESVVGLINDIDGDTDGIVDEADYANDADASTYKGNDIDSDGDGSVDQADLATDANQYDGTSPSDGTSGQYLQTDGTTVSWSDVTSGAGNLSGLTIDVTKDWQGFGIDNLQHLQTGRVEGGVVNRPEAVTNLPGSIYVRGQSEADPTQYDGDVLITYDDS